MSYQDYLGYCPISNPNSDLLSKGTQQKIPINYLGYEVLANSTIRQFGSVELQELNHELLVRIYTLTYISDSTLLEAILSTIQGYLNRSVATDHGSLLRTLDDNSLSILLTTNPNCKLLIILLKEYLSDYSKVTVPMLLTLNTTTFLDNKSLQLQLMLRKIEYLSFFVIVSVQNALLGYYKISAGYHQQLLSGAIMPTSTGDYIAKCFAPSNSKINYGLTSISFDNKYDKIDKWITSMLPAMIERTCLPITYEEPMVMSKIKKLINGNSQNTSIITNPFTAELKPGDLEGTLALEAFALVTLLCWKAGLSWIPIIGALVPYLDEGPMGRLFGVTTALIVTAFLTQNNIVELRFVPQALFATNISRMLSILFLGLMLGGIFAI